MQERPTQTRPLRHAGMKLAVIVGLTLLFSVFLPVVPIVLGVFLIVAVALHKWSPDLQPYVQPLLRVPVARASKRHARLLAAASLGVLLVVSGSVGATIRGQVRSQWEERERRREIAEEDVVELLERARIQLASGNVEGAELALMDAEAIDFLSAERQAEVEELLERVRLSGDSQAILDVLIRLPQAEFDAFEKGASVPAALEHGERALTYRAVELALAQMGEARRLRARP